MKKAFLIFAGLLCAAFVTLYLLLVSIKDFIKWAYNYKSTKNETT